MIKFLKTMREKVDMTHRGRGMQTWEIEPGEMSLHINEY